MDKEDQKRILGSAIRMRVSEVKNMNLSKVYGMRPDNAITIWKLFFDVRTYAEISGSSPDDMIRRCAYLAEVDETILKLMAVVGEWVSLDRSTRGFGDEEYDEFWSNPENQPTLGISWTEDENTEHEIQMLKRMWNQ